MTLSITSSYPSFEIAPTQGAKQRSMWKSRHGIPECRPGRGPSQGRKRKTRFSTSSVSRTFFAFAYGPK